MLAVELPVMSDPTDELLDDIDETTREVFDVASRRQARKKEGSRRDAYEKGLREVRRIAGNEQARELAERIRTDIRTNERFPSARRVRNWGAEICRESGHEVSTGSWLGA